MEAICQALGDTTDGLTGSEISHLLPQCKVPDPTPQITKWKRLLNAFAEFQNKHQVGNHVIVFIQKAMNPTAYTERPTVFAQRRARLNAVLVMCGYELSANGQVRRVQPASTIDEALERSNRLQGALRQRNVHAEVLRFCTAEILQQNYFHAVFEAIKSITSRLQRATGLSSDGAELIDHAFALGGSKTPRLAINGLDTETLISEQRGFCNLLKGLYGMIRNPLAHNPKIEWDMNEQDALDVLTIISLVHRKLDNAKQLA